jgi:hypothetical protein
MLTLDMTRLSETELVETVAGHCSEFGDATVLKIQTPDDAEEYGAVAVRMSTFEQASTLARKFGGSHCGHTVIIRILQQGTAIPNVRKRNHFFAAGAQA